MQVLHRVWLTLFHGDAINLPRTALSVAAVVLAVVCASWSSGTDGRRSTCSPCSSSPHSSHTSSGWSTPGEAATPRSRWPPRSRGACPARMSRSSRGVAAASVDGRAGHRLRRHHRGAVDRQSHCLPDTTEDRLQPADHGRRPGQPRLAASSRACRARARCPGRRSTSRPVLRPGSPGSSRRQRLPRLCYCSPRCCTTFRSRRWRASCSSPRCDWSISSAWSHSQGVPL